MAPGGPQGCSNQRNDKLSRSECAEGCWRSRRLEALVSTGTAWEHLLQRGACRKWVSSVLSWLAAATQSWTYRLSRRMSSCGWMEQQWLKIGCCHGRLFIVAWGMTLLWTMLTTYCAFGSRQLAERSATHAHAERLNPSSARWHQRAACKASRFPTSKGGSQAR